jgi:hypothetical protein
MSIVMAKLIKRKTDDGFVEVNDDIPLGKEYIFDLNTKQIMKGIHIPTSTYWEREMIRDIVNDGYMPTELFGL